MNKTSLAVAAVAVTGVSLALSALGQTGDNKLGKVHFETSCKPEAQKLFDRGMLYQHSFWYRASQKTFEEALKADPECAIAYWGIALSLLWNPHAAPAVQNLAQGSAALEKAKAIDGGLVPHRQPAPVEVHRERDRGMAQLALDVDRALALLEQERGEAVSQRVR